MKARLGGVVVMSVAFLALALTFSSSVFAQPDDDKPKLGPGETTLAEPERSISAVAFSPDEKHIAWCTSDALAVYSRSERKVVASIKVEQEFLEKTGLAFSPDGSELLLCRAGEVPIDEPLRRYAAADLKPLGSVGPKGAQIQDACYSTDGKSLLVLAQSDASLWNIAENRATQLDLKNQGVKGKQAHLLRSRDAGGPDRLCLADDGRIRFCTWGDWKTLKTWHVGCEIDRLAVSPDGALAAVLNKSGRWITVWNTATGELVKELPFDDQPFDPKTDIYRDRFHDVAFSADGRHLLIAGYSRLRILACATWELERAWKTKENEAKLLAIAPRGPEFVATYDASVDRKNRVTLWNVDELLRSLPPAPRPIALPEIPTTAGTPMFDLHEDNEPVAFTAGGKQVFTTGNYTKSAAHDVATKKTVWEIETKEDVRSIAVSPDGSRLAATYGDDAENDKSQHATLKVWDTKSKQLAVDLKARTSHLGAIEFSPDGKTLAIGEGIAKSSLGGCVAFLDLATNKIESQLPISRGLPTHIRYSRDGKQLAFVENQELSVWDLATNQLKHRHKIEERRGVRDLCFSPDGKHLVVGIRPYYGERNFGAMTFDTTTGEPLKLLDHVRAGVVSLDFSPTENLLLLAESGEGWNRAYRARSWPGGKLVFEVLHDNPRFDDGYVRFSPDGRLFVESAFGKAHVWNVEHLRDRQLQRDLKLAQRRDAWVDYAGNLPSLGYFDASDRTLDLVPDLTQPFALELLHTDGLTAAGLASLARLKNLARVELDSCEGIGDDALRSLVALPQLRQLKLAIEFTPAGLKNLTPLERLEVLELWQHDVDDSYIDEILRFRRLKELRLVFAKLSPEGIERLKAGLPAGCTLIEGWE